MTMNRIILCLLIAAIGCSPKKPPEQILSESQLRELDPELNRMSREEFAAKWRSSEATERQRLADLRIVFGLFDGAMKSEVLDALGEPDEMGIDPFNEDVTKYLLGEAPEQEGGGHYHLTFVFEDDRVIRVMGNQTSLIP